MLQVAPLNIERELERVHANPGETQTANSLKKMKTANNEIGERAIFHRQ